LYENSERVCEKDEIANSVWGSANMDKIDDERIAKLVSRLRERIEPDPDKPRYLLTAHGRGYRLMRQQKEAERKE
jgi:DNA-binding response OmpR family regulator